MLYLQAHRPPPAGPDTRVQTRDRADQDSRRLRQDQSEATPRWIRRGHLARRVQGVFGRGVCVDLGPDWAPWLVQQAGGLRRSLAQFASSPTPQTFDDASEPFLHHDATTAEIKTLCADLKLLGKGDFKALLKWRLKLRHFKQQVRCLPACAAVVWRRTWRAAAAEGAAGGRVRGGGCAGRGVRGARLATPAPRRWCRRRRRSWSRTSCAWTRS